MSFYDKLEKKVIKIHKDLYNQNRDRYIHFSSKEYKELMGLENNNHNFLGKGFMTVFDKVEKIISRIHKDIYYNNRDRYLNLQSKEYKELMGLENNNHNFLGKGFMTVFDKVEKIISRIHKDIYYNNRDRYLNLQSKEYRSLKKKEEWISH